MTSKRACDVMGTGPGFLPVVLIGLLLGYLNTLREPAGLPLTLLGHYLAGFAWGYLILQWFHIIAQALSMSADPIPADLDVANREQVRGQLERVTSCEPLSVRARHLMQSWAGSGDPRQVIVLAAGQSRCARATQYADTLFVLLLLGAALWINGRPMTVMLGFAALGFTLFARARALNHIDGYLESRLLARLPGNLPQMAITAADMAAMIGGQIETAFKNHVPQPEKIGAAIQSATEEASKHVAREIRELHKTLGDSQAVIVQSWNNAAKTTTTELRDVEKALATVVQDLTSGLTGNTEKISQAFGAHTRDLEKAFSSAGAQLKDGGLAGAQQLQAALQQQATTSAQNFDGVTKQLKNMLTEHAAAVQSANQSLAGQLEKITDLARSIEKVLHVQETVNASLQGVATSGEFQKTLTTLRTHLEASDQLLREAAKPRTIRLVENQT